MDEPIFPKEVKPTNFRERLWRFFSGRYGADSLFYFLFAFAVALAVLRIFFRQWWLQLAVYAVLAFALWRVFSRNLAARQAENQKFVALVEKLRRQGEVRRQRKNDRSHVYKRCRRCKAILRLPRRPGVHTTVCPKCGNSFKVRVRKKG